MKKQIKVIIVEDNEIINKSLVTLINGAEGFTCIGSFFDCETMLAKIHNLEPDVVLMDIQLKGMSGIQGVKKLREIDPDLNVLMLTIHEENDLVFEALCAGASGYIIKKTHPLRLLESIEEAYEGGAPMSSNIARKVISFFQPGRKISSAANLLTERELDIIKELAKGKTYYAIALTFGISKDTVRFHIKKIYGKLHVHSQAEAVSEAMKKGIL
ncbi:MAG: response regulator [Bacteroidota bacterium]|jgi:DNA-binding NarL/FixJ family response regulator|nr:response regulator transcription factor [Ignavibacteria bacterium]HEX2963156.1 response regulator transcription factor [Ignavibacteriales bacterium]MCU7497830.1 response regulator transcription factor [Ignavibacteria bacterium]MCU7511111.1 response regulator transcription factor [Ignavibacteria bacterium]MCU7518658.1 response regulator transcription factor [Ignavibacteria bacterium]